MYPLLFIALWLGIRPGHQAQQQTIMYNQQQDSAAIAQALEQYYFQGLYEGNIDLLNKVFQPGILLFGDVKGVPYAKTLEQYLEGVKNRQSPKDSGQPFKGGIISINTVNSIAVAEVSIKMYAFHYHDILAFHKIDGQWRIVNKLLTDTQE